MSRLLAILVLPFALAIMAPLALVFVVLFYISVLARAIWAPIAWAVFRKSAQPEPARKPHFLEVPPSKTAVESSSLPIR